MISFLFSYPRDLIVVKFYQHDFLTRGQVNFKGVFAVAEVALRRVNRVSGVLQKN